VHVQKSEIWSILLMTSCFFGFIAQYVGPDCLEPKLEVKNGSHTLGPTYYVGSYTS
jgi:hypothetical protein